MSGSRKFLVGSAVAIAVVATMPVSSAQAAAAPWCKNADLHASYHATDSATSHRFGRIVLSNVSHHSCRTGGYGGISYVGHGNGTQIGAAATRDPGVHPVVTLQPGQRVRSDISETVADVFSPATCHPTHVDGFRVYVPDATKSQFIAHPTTGCANTAVHLISHKPYRRP
jgi:Protein of unknown function (DUF4232)